MFTSRSMLGKYYSIYFEIFPYFSTENRIRHFMQTVRLIESCFLGKQISLSTAESAISVVSVKRA